MRKIRVALCALIGLASLRGASAAEFNPEGITKSFEPAQLVAVAQEAGFQAKVMTTQKGKSIVRITSESGSFLAAPSGCESEPAPHCSAVEFGTSFEAATASAGSANEYNSIYAFAQAYYARGRMHLSRVEITKFGISLGNIAVSMTSFDKAARHMVTHLSNGGRSVMLEPKAGPSLPRTAFSDTGNAAAPDSLAHESIAPGDFSYGVK